MIADLIELIFGVAEAASEGAAARSRLRSHRRRRLRALRDQVAAFRFRSLADSPDGPVALEGLARARELLTAPLSGRPVIGFRLRLSGLFLEENARQERELLDVSAVHDFELVEPASGRAALVRPHPCLPLLEAEATQKLELAEVIKPPLAPIIDRALVSASDLASALELRAVEHLLEPDEPVFAYGVARQELDVDAEAAYRESPHRIVLGAPEGGLLVLADRGRDALLAALEHEWELLPPE
jgi:hypothetical protein